MDVNILAIKKLTRDWMQKTSTRAFDIPQHLKQLAGYHDNYAMKKGPMNRKGIVKMHWIKMVLKVSFNITSYVYPPIITIKIDEEKLCVSTLPVLKISQ